VQVPIVPLPACEAHALRAYPCQNTATVPARRARGPFSQRLPTGWVRLPRAVAAAARGPLWPPPAALRAVRAGFCQRWAV